MINPLIKNDVSIDKLKLCGFDFNHFDKSKLLLKVPRGLRYGDNIEPCGFENKGIVKDGLMIDIYHDDKIWIEFNPNLVPIKKVDKILKNDWGISTNIMDMDVNRIDLERTRMMDKDLIQYHTMLTYVTKARIKPWEKHDTFYYGTSEGLKQFCIYTKEPKERLVRGELRLFRELDKRYDIHELKYLHDTETLNSIYVKEYDSYMGTKLSKMLHDDKIISIYDDANKMHGYEELFTYCVINKGKSLNAFLVWVGFNSMSYDGWMQFANSTLLDKYQRRRLKKMIEDMAKDSTKFSNRFRLDMVQRDIRNLLKFRDVA
jgi:hypothetical protein